MANKKVKTNKKLVNKKISDVEDLEVPAKVTSFSKKSYIGSISKVLLVVFVGAVVYLLAQKYRGVFVAGMVNNKIISRWELNQRLLKNYGKTVLDEMTNETILRDEAKKNGVTVVKKDIDDEVTSIKAKTGGDEAFKAALQQYGIDETQLRDRVEISLFQRKLAEKLFKVDVTDAEVKKYFDDNAASFKDKKFDDVKADIKTSLIQQKVQQQFNDWFDKLRKGTNVSSFI